MTSSPTSGSKEAPVAAIVPAAIQLFEMLEPQAQKGIAALITKIHHKQLTAQDYLDQAATLINSKPPVVPTASSSTNPPTTPAPAASAPASSAAPAPTPQKS